ncbi:MAG: mechanosensitive ion channel [Bacteroidales bacterium]|nr:mechanosensitive ion channel [Bacteroidales bacterium]
MGIGFGLQGVVYNFIAGLILTFERPIQKGDTIELGTLFGNVINIGVRASTIRTYDGSEVIVPNGNLISNELINWTLSDRRRRKDVKVHVAYGNDPHEILKLLFDTVKANENVLPNPKPWPIFEGFGDSSLDFRIMFWVEFDRGMTIQSEVAMNIYDAFAEAGIQIPFPQTDLHVKSFDPTDQKTVFPLSKKQVKRNPNTKTDQSEDQNEKE